jgi:hypothetical protein
MGVDVATLQICGVTLPPSRYHAGITPIDRPGASFDTRSVGIDVLGPVRVAGSDARLGHRDRVILSALALELELEPREVDPFTWESQACSMARRTLTRAEWSQFLPGRAFAPACR